MGRWVFVEEDEKEDRKLWVALSGGVFCGVVSAVSFWVLLEKLFALGAC